MGKQCENARFRESFVLITHDYYEMFSKNCLLRERCLTTERTAVEEINL